jgi:hypothetical protein
MGAGFFGPSSPPHLLDPGCGQTDGRRFQVLPPDLHGFDGDDDGIWGEIG